MVSYLYAASNIASSSLYGAYNIGQAVATRKAVQDTHFLQKLYKHRFTEVCSQIALLAWQSFSIGTWVEASFLMPGKNVMDTFLTRTLFGGAVVGVTLLVSYKVCMLAYRYFNPSDDLQRYLDQARQDSPQSIQPNIKLEWDLPSVHHSRLSMYLTQGVINISLIFLQSNPILFATAAIAQLYSLAKAIHLKWFSVKRTFLIDQPGIEGARSYTISYLASAFPAKASQDEHNCTICLDSDPAPCTQFCPSHSFHLPCLIQWLCGTGNSFSNALKALDRSVDIVREEHRDRHGLGTGIYSTRRVVTYRAEIEEKKLPSCPLCRSHPIQNDIEVVVKDRDDGEAKEISAHIRIVQ